MHLFTSDRYFSEPVKESAKISSIYTLHQEKDWPVIHGWAINNKEPDSIFDIEIFINDKFFAKLRNDLKRDDLKRKKITNGAGGFSFSLKGLDLAPGRYFIQYRFPDGSFSRKYEMKTGESRYNIRIEKFLPQLVGFANDSLKKEPLFKFSLYIDGEYIASLNNSQERADLIKRKITGGGFKFDFAARKLPFGKHKITFKLPDGTFSEDFDFEILPQYKNNIDSFYPVIKGWCMEVNHPTDIFPVKLHVDGLYLGTAFNNKLRNDLRLKNITAGQGGFELACNVNNLSTGQHECEIECPDGSFSKNIPFVSKGPAIPALGNLKNFHRTISVIIPVLENIQGLVATLDSLQCPAGGKFEAIIVCSENILPHLAFLSDMALDYPLAIAREHASSPGEAIKTGFACAGANDAVILKAGCQVGPFWLKSFLGAASSKDRAAIITSFVDKLPDCPQYLQLNESLPAGANPADYASALKKAAMPLWPKVMDINPACFYIKRKFTRQLGNPQFAANLTDIYAQLRDLAHDSGWHVRLDNRNFIHNTELEATEKESAKSTDSDLPYHPDLLLCRYYARLAAQDWKYFTKKRLLYVAEAENTRSLQNALTLMREMSEFAQCYILNSENGSIKLRILENNELSVIYEHQLDNPPSAQELASPEYDAIFASLIFQYCIDIVHIFSFRGHSRNITAIAREQGCKIVCTLNDFYALNPEPSCGDDAGVFLGDDYVIQGSVWRNIPTSLPLHKPAFIAAWQKCFADILSRADAICSPYASVIELYKARFPELVEKTMQVLPSAEKFSFFEFQKAAPMPGYKLKIIIPGDLVHAAGVSIVDALCQYDALRNDALEFHILGNCELSLDSGKVITHGDTVRANPRDKIAEIRPHAAMIMSAGQQTWPGIEWLWACGLPVFTPKNGIYSSEVEQTGCGFLLENMDIPVLYEQLFATFFDCEKIGRVKSALLKWQQSAGSVLIPQVMAASYYEIYRNLLNGRDAFYKNKKNIRIGTCTRRHCGSGRVRVLEQCVNNFERDIAYMRLEPEELLNCARNGIIHGAIIQRIAVPKQIHAFLLAELKEQNIPYMYEIDDDLFNLPKDKDFDPDSKKYLPVLHAIAANSRIMRVTTDVLKKRLSKYNDNIEASDNRLSERCWYPEPRKRKNDYLVRAFYFGSPTHFNDLLMILPALDAAAKKHPNFRLMVTDIGRGTEGLRKRYPFIEFYSVPEEKKPFIPHTRLLHELTEMLDFAIAPLEDTFFNCAKSSVKILETGAIGLPCIASCVGPYSSMAHIPHVILADNTLESWLNALEKKIERAEKNRIDGLETRRYVLLNYSHDKREREKLDNMIFNMLQG